MFVDKEDFTEKLFENSDIQNTLHSCCGHEPLFSVLTSNVPVYQKNKMHGYTCTYPGYVVRATFEKIEHP